MKQNERHVQVLGQCIGCSRDFFVPMVIFSRNSDLRVNTQSPVLHADTMLDYIHKYERIKLSDEDIRTGETRIRSSWNPSYDARMRHKMRYC